MPSASSSPACRAVSRVEVVVPWLGGCEHRERAWAWVRGQYEANHPDWDLVVAEADPGPWCKAAPVMSAVRCSTADVIVVADSDVWHPRIELAVEAVESGLTGWAIPHRGVFRLTEQGTAQLLAGAEDWERLPLDQPPYRGTEGGGITVLRRETLLEVPLDPRFVGWGQEDEAFGWALRCVVGMAWRGRGPLFHLWHPPQERLSRRWGSLAGKALYRRYRAASSSPEAMRALLEEIHEPSPTDANAVRGHEPQRVGGHR